MYRQMGHNESEGGPPYFVSLTSGLIVLDTPFTEQVRFKRNSALP